MDWANIFFTLGHYLHLDKYQIWNLTLPQVHYYMKKCNEHIEFNIRVSTMSFGAMFGGGGGSQSEGEEEDQDPNAEYENHEGKDYKVADEEDMEWLSKIL